MDFNDFQAKLYEYNALHEGDEIQEGTVDRIEPVFADSWPAGIDPHLHIALRMLDIADPISIRQRLFQSQ